MIVIQYNCHNQNLIYIEAELVEMNDKNIIERVIVNGKEFTHKDLMKFLEDGFVWFLTFGYKKCGMPTREELKTLINVWQGAYNLREEKKNENKPK